MIANKNIEKLMQSFYDFSTWGGVVREKLCWSTKIMPILGMGKDLGGIREGTCTAILIHM